MLQLQPATLTQKQKNGLHLLLVLGIISYLFSPLMDHWLGHDTHTRPHTHVSFPENNFITIAPLLLLETSEHFPENSEHEEGFLCVLDVNALFFAAIDVSLVPTRCMIRNAPFIFDFFHCYVKVTPIYLLSLDPPPRSNV